MKQKTKKRIQGSISVLLIIILLPSMVLSALIVDTSRINMARSMVSSAGDLALNSALADYDTILKDVYGLFAMSQAKTNDELAAEIKEYFEDTLVSYGVTTEAEAGDYVTALMGDFNELVSGTGSIEVSNFLNMEVSSDFVVTKEAESGLDNPQIMRKQIVDYMKYRAPVNFSLSFLDSVKAFTTVEDQSQVVVAQVQAQESLQPVTQGCKTVIDGIRDFDELVTAIDSGDQAVTGLNNSTDTVVIEIAKYHEQIDKYKSVWGENYQNINELNLIFLLKSPEVTDKYLSGMSYSANEFFITTDDINADNSGISMEVSLADNYDDAVIQVQQQKNKLATAPYSNVRTNYSGDTFLNRMNMDTNKTSFLNREEAIATFIKFEAFLLNDTSKSSITYNEVADTLEQLYVLHMYHENQMSMLDEQIETKTEERDNKKTELDNKAAEVTAAETALQNGKDAQTAVQTAAEALETAQTATSTAATALSTAQSNLNAYTGSKLSVAYLNLEKAVDDAQTAYDEAVAAQEDAQSAYDDAVATAPTDSEIAQMESTLNTKKTEYTTLSGEHQTLCNEVAALESTKNLAISEYKNSISGYMSFTNAYQHDLELYEDYKSVAKQLITTDAKAVQGQLLKIEENILKIIDALNQIGVDLSTLKSLIGSYETKVDAWETANNQYVSNNTADSFSKQNAADIASTDSQYDLDSLQTLLDYVMAIEQEYRNFYDYITNADRYKYGTARIDTLDSNERVLNAVPSDLKASLSNIITKEEANNQLNTLYADETTPSIEIDKLTFVKDGVLPIQFLKYLNENFPKEEKTLTLQTESDGTAPDPKGEYENLKTEMARDEEGDEAINNVDGNSYGYTFQTRETLPGTGLPSSGKSKKTVDTKSIQITENEGNVDASSSLQSQSTNLSSVLGNVEDVLGAGLENIYIVDYIFQNFSYNTLVQEMVVEGENLTTYPQVMTLSSHENLGNYLGTAKTLSNYNITGENNYLYGAEVEYILFGNENPKMNVTYTKGSIYAIRFAFNSIFAFTDSEIRNTTMAAGLAVQAATMGIVPYQLVQVVLQLALAAAESAVDLDMMSKGLKVVVVKTRDTWSMSVSGAIGLMTDTVQAVAGDAISDAISSAINVVNEGINTVLEASAEELQGAVTNLTDTVSNAAKSKGEEIVDGVYVELQSKIDELLNDLQFTEFYTRLPDGTIVYMSQDEVIAQINLLFDELRGSVDGMMAKYAENPIAEALMQNIVDDISGPGGVIDELQNKINTAVATAYAEAPEQPDVGGIICGQMLQIKYDILTGLQDRIEGMELYINLAAQNSIATITGELNAYAQQCVTESGQKLEETLTTEVKDKVVDSLNDFSNTYLKEPEMEDVDLGAGGEGGNKSTGSKVASMIKFGYKDYLMLLMFISVCVNDDAVLARTADVIQLNFQNASGTADKEGRIVFRHQKGSEFTLAEAKTYVSVEGSAKLDMLLLDMDFFSRMLGEDSTAVAEQTEAVSTIRYKGIAGY